MKELLAIVLTIIAVVSLLFGASKTEGKSSEFESWKVEFNVRFDSTFEDAYREKIFLRNLEQIRFHNSDPHRTYDKGLNQFAALTQKEFIATYTSHDFPISKKQTSTDDSSCQMKSLGDINWVSKGAVTSVKNQGSCNAGYAFAAVGAIQGLSKIGKQHKLQDFSEQQIIDCSRKYGNSGCSKGSTDSTYNYVRDYGIFKESEYPYKGYAQACQKEKADFKIYAHHYIDSCSDLQEKLLINPISVSVDSSMWKFYKSGIFNDCPSSPQADHAVLVVGMSEKYWLIKNSWSSAWGQNGYIRLAMGNNCGVCHDGSYPSQ